MPAITIRDLIMEYSSGGFVVRPFNNFDLDFETGDLALLLGASGCGKTTLLSMLASILTPSSRAPSSQGTDARRWASSSRGSTSSRA
jgi:putative ABC transport system ATP-binding protein